MWNVNNKSYVYDIVFFKHIKRLWILALYIYKSVFYMILCLRLTFWQKYAIINEKLYMVCKYYYIFHPWLFANKHLPIVVECYISTYTDILACLKMPLRHDYITLAINNRNMVPALDSCNTWSTKMCLETGSQLRVLLSVLWSLCHIHRCGYGIVEYIQYSETMIRLEM